MAELNNFFQFGQNFDFKIIIRNHRKNFYENYVYESVDDKSLYFRNLNIDENQSCQ